MITGLAPPLGAHQAHIFPKLKSGSLISVGQLCDHGTFTANSVSVFYNNDVILTGEQSMETKNLWVLELSSMVALPTSAPAPTGMAPQVSIGTTNSIIKHDTMTDRIAFYHAVMFSPVISTWCAAIDQGFFITWPECISHYISLVTSDKVRKYLPHGSIPMAKGHLHQERTNVH